MLGPIPITIAVSCEIVEEGVGCLIWFNIPLWADDLMDRRRGGRRRKGGREGREGRRRFIGG